MAPAGALLAAQPPGTPERNARWNFRWATLCGALFEGGAAFVETGTVVAAFLGRLTPSPVAVGAAESIARVGWLLPQILVANYAQGLRYRKPIYLIAGWGRAACLGFLAGLLLVWPDVTRASGSELVLAAFFMLWTAFSLVSGLAGVPYNDIIGRTVPSNRRSRLLAGRAFVGGLLGVGAGWVIRVTLQATPDGLLPYGFIFATGAVVLALSTGCFALVREPPAMLVRPRSRLLAFLVEGGRVLQQDRRFRLFLAAQLLAGLTTMAAPFYLVHARQIGAIAEAEVGTFVAAQMLGGLALNPLWGWWGDRRGKLSLLKVLAWAGAVSPGLAIALPWLSLGSAGITLAAYAIIFFFLGSVSSGRVVADLGYLMEISPDERRPQYSGYMNVLVAPSRVLPLLAGVFISVSSFEVLFALAALAVPARLAVLARLEPQTPTVPAPPRGAGTQPPS